MGQAQSDRGAPPELASPVRPKFFNANGAVRNPYRATLEEMKDVQLEQLQQFRDLAAAGQWEQIHRQHFDWYMWPVEDGSQSQYNVLAEDVAELLADDDWVDRYHESLALVSAAWGWDVVGARPVEPLQPGQGWTDWDIRLREDDPLALAVRAGEGTRVAADFCQDAQTARRLALRPHRSGRGVPHGVTRSNGVTMKLARECIHSIQEATVYVLYCNCTVTVCATSFMPGRQAGTPR
jgi:hypothetical protein